MKPIGKPKFQKITLLIGTCLLFISCQQDPKQKGYEIFPDMVHSVALEAYSENPLTPDGKTMMLPAKGSVARGHMPYKYTGSPADAQRAGLELMNPTKNTERNLARGKLMYENYCLVCHGETGQGDGPLIPKFPNPPSFTSKTFRTYPDGRIFNAISAGFGDMPSHSNQIYEEDRWFIVNYIHELQKK